ncbi:MAG: cardiolipin synthase [Lachnospiraceae bacterium]
MGKIVKKLMTVLTSRVILVGISILIQLFWTVRLVDELTKKVPFLHIILLIVSTVIVLMIMLRDDNSAYKIAWVILIMCMPIFGSILYILNGNKRPTRWMRNKMQFIIDETNFLLKQDENVLEELKREDLGIANQAKYIADKAKFPIYKNTTTQYYTIGEEYFEALKTELKKAKHYIFMEYFIISYGFMWETILEILREKVEEGVDVRIIYDDMGCITTLPFGYTKKLEEMGIKAQAFNRFIPFFSSVLNHRDHRKITVIDGHTAFTGGVNLADEYINKKERFGHWKDTGMKITGDAVFNFTMLFLQMWDAESKQKSDYRQYFPDRYWSGSKEEDGYVQPYGDSPLDEEGVGEGVYLNIISNAKKYLYIFTPYLIIGDEMMTALCMAAKRGVDVRIIVPHIPDKKIVFLLTKSYYPRLIKAGIKIYEYKPGFLHAKCFVADDEVAVVGTINMDYRSLYLHFECATFMYRSKAVMQVKKDVEETIEKSILIPEEKCNTSLPVYLFQGLLRIFAPLF